MCKYLYNFWQVARLTAVSRHARVHLDYHRAGNLSAILCHRKHNTGCKRELCHQM